MTEIVGNSCCPQCVERGRDKTSNHLMLFDNGSAYCNRCGYHEGNGTFTEPAVKFGGDISPEDAAKQVSIFEKESTVKALKDRLLNIATCKHFGVRVTLSEEDGTTQTSTAFPVNTVEDYKGYKLKYPSKRFGKEGIIKNAMFFGSDVCPKTGNKLFITEGENDAMALYQIIYSMSQPQWRNQIAVVSLANGAGGAAKELGRNRKLIEGFKEVVLAFDQDKAGRDAVEACTKVLGRDRVSVPVFSEKDANDMLIKGKDKELYFSCIKTTKPKPASVVDVEDLFDQALVKPEMGLSFPWKTLTKLTYGIRRATTYCVAAAPKIGKTDFEYELIAHLIKVHGEQVALYDLETHPAKTLKRLAGKMKAAMFHKPDIEFDMEDLKDGMNQLRDHIQFYKHDGSRDWEDIKATMRYQAGEGIWLFIIDPLTALISRYDSSTANDKLNEICTDIAEMNAELGITVFIFSHLNPARTGKAHDEGGRVLSSQFTGSRAMEKWFHYGIGIERDRLNEDEEIRNTSTHRLLFDREYGEGGFYECTYYRDTGVYGEKVSEPMIGDY